MSLRIQCPSCQRQFKVSEELMGRTVECGACEHQFKVEEPVLSRTKPDKVYPGEQRKGRGLEGFARSDARPDARSDIPVQFQTAHYNEKTTAADVIPNSPQQTISTGLGVAVQLIYAVLLVLGTRTETLFVDMELDKRLVLSGFVVVVGAALIFYGTFHHKKRGLPTLLALAALVMGLAFFLPIPRTMPDRGPGIGEPPPVEPSTPVEVRLSGEQIADLIGYSPIENALARSQGRADTVMALWAPDMEERFKYQIQKFLQRKTGAAERPSYYKRPEGSLFVLEGVPLDVPDLEVYIERFGEIEDIYPEKRIIVIQVDSGRLLEASPELMRELTDPEHPRFYHSNRDELSHIDIDRVKDAAQRLADAEPLTLQTEIHTHLIQLLEEEADDEFLGVLGEALKTWSKPGDGSEPAVAQAVHRQLAREAPVPRSLIEFLIGRKDPESIALTKILWVSDPGAWESFLTDAGSEAESEVAAELGNSDPAVQQSAIRILRRIGTTESLPALRTVLAGAKSSGDTDLVGQLEAAISVIESGAR